MFVSSPRTNNGTSRSKCDQTVALNNFFQKYMWRPPTILGLVGSGCEDATIAVAAISHYFNITQVSASILMDCISA